MDRKSRILLHKRSAYNVYVSQHTSQRDPANNQSLKASRSMETHRRPTSPDSTPTTPRPSLMAKGDQLANTNLDRKPTENASSRRSSAIIDPSTGLPIPNHMSSDDETAPAPPDFSRRGIHIPSRTSSKTPVKHQLRRKSRDYSPSISTTPESRGRGSADSVISYETAASSIGTVPQLQVKALADQGDKLEPLLEDDPGSFDLLAPSDSNVRGFSLERRADLLFSREHLETIFNDSALLFRFTSFLSSSRPQSVPLLIYYLDALKALRAINYANAVAEALEPLEGFDFTEHPARPTVNPVLEERANLAFDALVRNELPAFITHVYINVVSLSIQRRITGTLPPHLREASEGLAEVFCISDPSRQDNPLVFASEEFHRTTQYGVSYAIGRNCRFLQGPKTDPYSTERLRKAIEARKDTSEVFLNYRRDGSPFMNLLMVAPLLDSKGELRYFLGAQVDVTGLVKDCIGLEALQRVVARQEGKEDIEDYEDPKDEFQELSEMFNIAELDTVRKFGGHMHREHVDDDNDMGINHRPRLLLKDQSNETIRLSHAQLSANGKLEGIYQNYILVRPYPSLRILFTSPSLRVPGILQCPFMERIGGSVRVRDELSTALSEGRGVTAKVRWLASRSDTEGRSRWLHCTPLLGQNGQVGVWMIILVDDENSQPVRRFRPAPPVARNITPPVYKDDDSITSKEITMTSLPGLTHDAIPKRSASMLDRYRASSPARTGPLSVNSFALD